MDECAEAQAGSHDFTGTLLVAMSWPEFATISQASLSCHNIALCDSIGLKHAQSACFLSWSWSDVPAPFKLHVLHVLA